MKTLKQPARILRTGLMALTLAALLGGAAAAPALAEDWHHDRDFRAHDEWRGHDRRGGDWGRHGHHRFYAYGAPAYRYAPPPVNFVFPLDIR